MPGRSASPLEVHVMAFQGAVQARALVQRRVRQQIERRTIAFRNQRRTNLLLGLMRNNEFRVHDLDHCTEILREAERSAGGRIEYQRRGYCTGRAFDPERRLPARFMSTPS